MIEYSPAPPAVYPSDEPPSYSRTPLPPLETGAEVTDPAGSHYGHAPSAHRDANGVPPQPYDPRYDEQAREMGPPPYPAERPAICRSRRSPGPAAHAQRRCGSTAAGGCRRLCAAGRYRGCTQPGRWRRSGGRSRYGDCGIAARGSARTRPAKQLPSQFRRQLVDYPTSEPAGTIIIDTPHTFLYLVRGHGKALRYGIGVGREGFTWAGSERVTRMSEWPDWHPPKEMIERQPYLPRFMAGGESNPLGARALYLGNTIYRIHGTNQPSTIGSFVSSGCIRLTNPDISDLYGRVNVGTRVVVLSGPAPASASAQAPVTR